MEITQTVFCHVTKSERRRRGRIGNRTALERVIWTPHPFTNHYPHARILFARVLPLDPTSSSQEVLSFSLFHHLFFFHTLLTQPKLSPTHIHRRSNYIPRYKFYLGFVTLSLISKVFFFFYYFPFNFPRKSTKKIFIRLL